MEDSLSNLGDNLSGINNNKDIMIASLTQSINKISKIDQKIAQIDKQEPKKFVNNMRSMIASLSKIDKKISQAELINKFPNTYQLSNKDFNKFALLLRKDVYPYEYNDS